MASLAVQLDNVNQFGVRDMKYDTAALAALLASACQPAVPYAPTPAAPQPAPPVAVVAPPPEGLPLAPSYLAKTSCPDDGPRLPLSGVCASRATSYMSPDSAEGAPPAGCEWGTKETLFADHVLLYRALTCGANTTNLEYAGGARAAELSYSSSALYPQAVAGPDEVKPVVRVATYETNDDFRLKETIGSDASIAKCEIRAAGAGYPASAKVIAPKSPGADCGLYALSDASDNFWLVGEEWVYAFTLPKGPHDIDPSTLTILAPQ